MRLQNYKVLIDFCKEYKKYNRTKKPFQRNGSFGFHNLTTVDLKYF